VSIFCETFVDVKAWRDDALLAKWQRIREIRDVVNQSIEVVRAAGGVGSSLQAEIVIAAPREDQELLAGLGDDLRFVTITSQARVVAGDALAVTVTPSSSPKCERCWHWRSDVGADPKHPSICGRCVSNLFGAGEPRSIA
jgi:isoleucyl-tRNA synthetase